MLGAAHSVRIYEIKAILRGMFSFILFSLFLPLEASEIQAGERDQALESFRFSRLIEEKVGQFSEISTEEFPRVFPELRSRFDQFFERKRNVCHGKFSTVILTSADLGQGPLADLKPDDFEIRRLGRQEREACLVELKKMQAIYLSGVYQARRTYLESLHQQRMLELEKSHQAALQTLEELTSN